MKQIFTLFFATVTVLSIFSCTKNHRSEQTSSPAEISTFTLAQKDSIIDVYIKNGASKFPLYSQERQLAIDKGLEVDSTIAYFWQQKAMPLFKQQKYEIGMEFIDKAVKYDREKYQNYRAFIKCIFSKQYRDAIADFQDYQNEFGHGFVMDHSYDFHIALSYLQLNEFEKAEEIFERDYKRTIANDGEGWLHHLDLFYYGISKLEQNEYEGAIGLFDKALEIYPQFSDVQYYKAITLAKLNKMEEAKSLIMKAKNNAEKGYTINEDNVIYEKYPYQVRW